MYNKECRFAMLDNDGLFDCEFGIEDCKECACFEVINYI
jgi:hypothetical protein